MHNMARPEAAGGGESATALSGPGPLPTQNARDEQRPTQPRRRGDSLWPREHGATFQLVAPLASALLAGVPHGGAVCWAVVAVAVFAAHEPALILLGRRGPSTRRRLSTAARRRLWQLGALAGIAAGVGFVETPGHVLKWLAWPAVLGGLSCVSLLGGHERSLVGQLAVAATFASLATPIALASGHTLPAALGLWLVWTVSHGFGTLAGRAAVHARRDPGARTGLAMVLACAAMAWAVLWDRTLAIWFLAVSPVPFVALAVSSGWSPRRPAQLGFTLAVAMLLTLGLAASALATG